MSSRFFTVSAGSFSWKEKCIQIRFSVLYYIDIRVEEPLLLRLFLYFTGQDRASRPGQIDHNLTGDSLDDVTIPLPAKRGRTGAGRLALPRLFSARGRMSFQPLPVRNTTYLLYNKKEYLNLWQKN